MNYLAHAYCSFGDPDLLAGNMLSDFIKGKKQFDFPEGVQRGIRLHRLIDEFTDTHPLTAKAKSFFQSAYGLYAAPFTDIVYDHFLATDESRFTDESLRIFAGTTYDQLRKYEPLFPEKFRIVFHYMELHNWLYNYRLEEGIFRSFAGLVHRARYMNDPAPAVKIFIGNYEELKKIYEQFFPLLIKHCNPKP